MKSSYLDDITSVIALALSKRMRMLIPMCIWTGLSIAFYSGILVSMLTATMPDLTVNEQYQNSMMAMVVFGFGELLGCFFIGYVVDKRGSKFASCIDVIIILLMIMVTLLFLSVNKFNFLAFLMTFMWGF